MTRKDYVNFADAIRSHVATLSDVPPGMIPHPSIKQSAKGMANIIADVCQKDNPRFDRARFMEACGLTD